MHLILTGATGLVGSGVLARILSLPPGVISRLSILSRRPVPMAEGKPGVTVIEHKDLVSILQSFSSNFGARRVVFGPKVSR